jgi:hypothetical protein
MGTMISEGEVLLYSCYHGSHEYNIPYPSDIMVHMSTTDPTLQISWFTWVQQTLPFRYHGSHEYNRPYPSDIMVHMSTTGPTLILTTYINGSRCKNCVSHLCQHATLVYIILVTLFSNDTFCSLIFEECVGSVVLLWTMISEGWGLLYSCEPWYLKGRVCCSWHRWLTQFLHLLPFI